MKRFFSLRRVAVYLLIVAVVALAEAMREVAQQSAPYTCGLDKGFQCGYWDKIEDLSFLLILLAITVMSWVLPPLLLLVWALQGIIKRRRQMEQS